MMFFTLLFLFTITTFFSTLYAVLDGTTGNFPIELDTTYSFSNFEWARGYVKFRNGFDVPTNGTVFLGINQEVEGPITMNGGTIILERDIILGKNVTLNEGSSSFSFLNTNNHIIYLRDYLDFRHKCFISGDVIIDGMKTGFLQVRGSGEMVARTNNTFSFSNILLDTSIGSLVFEAPSGSRVLNIENVRILGVNNNIGSFVISGNCIFLAEYVRYVSFVTTIKPNSSLLVNTFCSFYCAEVTLESSSSHIILDSAKLLNVSGQPINIGGLGKIFIQGKSIFNSDFGMNIESNVDLIFRSAAQLIIDKEKSFDPGTHLTIN